MKKLTEKAIVTSFNDDDSIAAIIGGAVKRLSFANLKKGMVENQDLLLNQIAFYIEPNVPADNGTSTSVNVGGNSHMMALWMAQWKAALMDVNGNTAELSSLDNRFTTDGVKVVDDNNSIVSGLANCNFMGIMPKSGMFLQSVVVNSVTRLRLWISLVAIPGGWIEEPVPVGMFKGSFDSSGRLRSLPNVQTADSVTINQFFTKAQLLGKDWGLAGCQWHNMMLFRMMAKYATRDCQNAALSDGTKIWGVGLDGTESTSASDKFAAQRYIVTGSTLSLGSNDGKVAVNDANGQTVHKVKFAVFEDPWGQKWEFDGHLASIDSTVNVRYWKSNFIPSDTPTEATFASIDTVSLLRNAASGGDAKVMNLIETEGAQGAFMIPKSLSGGNISYGDSFWWDANGRVWLWGGGSSYGSDCGLSSASSDNGWSISSADFSARLDYHGTVKMVSGKQLVALNS